MKTQKIKSFRIFFLLLLAMVLSSPAFASPIVDGVYDANEGYSSHIPLNFDVTAKKKGSTFNNVTYTKGQTFTVPGGGLHYYQSGIGENIFVALVLPTTLVDNSYGDTRIGWGNKKHNLGDLQGSDKAVFQFYGSDSTNPVLSFTLEYWKDTSNQHVVNWDTSLRYNLDNFSSYTENSPAAVGDPLNPYSTPSEPGWIYDVIYEVEVDGKLFDGGFGGINIPELHISPNKLGANKTTPNPVPIPGAVWLFGSGLIGLFGYRKRAKK